MCVRARACISDFGFLDLKVEVTALSSYEEKEEQFKEQVVPPI